MSNDPFRYFRAGAVLPQVAADGTATPAQPLTAPPAMTPTDLHKLHERLRRRDAARKADAPDNDLFGVLSGPRSTDTDWRDLIDGIYQATITPAAANGQAVVALSPLANGLPIWSGAARDFVDPSDAIRVGLVVRTFFVLPSAATATGNIWFALQTTGGDLLPLAAMGASALYNSTDMSRCGAGILPDIMANQTLICNSVGVGAPVSLSVVLGVSLIGIRSRVSE